MPVFRFDVTVPVLQLIQRPAACSTIPLTASAFDAAKQMAKGFSRNLNALVVAGEVASEKRSAGISRIDMPRNNNDNEKSITHRSGVGDTENAPSSSSRLD